MDLMGMMGKLKETQQKMEETKQKFQKKKKRLDTVLVDEQSTDGLLKVTITANRKITSVTIADELLQDKEQLEDYMILVMNKAIEKASKVNEAELDAVAKMDMPMMPGMEELFK
jgi:DNA-binding protein YbaB